MSEAVRVVFLRRNLPDSLSYRVDQPRECVGRAVVVPLQGQLTVGLAVDAHQPDLEVELASVTKILPFPEPLSEDLLELGKWLGRYYLTSLHTVFRRILPPSYLPEIKETWERLDNTVVGQILDEVPDSPTSFETIAQASDSTYAEVRRSLNEARDRGVVKQEIVPGRPDVSRQTYQFVKLETLPKDPDELSPRARELIEELETNGDCFRKDLPEALKRTKLLDRVEEAGYISREQRVHRRIPRGRDHEQVKDPEFTLTEEQSEVLESIRDDVDAGTYQTHLVHGITGSGKTEVYFRATREVLDRGQSVLVLVPEITLASFQARRFVERFGEEVGLWHSEMSRGERRDEWERIQSGEARLILGVQSAVFSPIKDLGLIIVDEEHDSSYKAGQAPRYNARDVAVKRGHITGCPVVLGTATPSVESHTNRQRGRYRGHRMVERPTGGEPAKVLVEDLRNEEHLLTKNLIEKTGEVLNQGARAIWFLNRRGSAQFLLCQECGSVPECSNCSVSLTFHSNPARLRCHYCGFSRAVYDRCPECGAEEISRIGSGTEKLATIARKYFENSSVLRLDADTVGRRGGREQRLREFESTPGALLVGTQMVTKGLDFPDLLFVGIVNADVSLHFPDFRSGERTFQQVLQVIGRAGRDRPDAEVLLQTYNPNHYALQRAINQDFEGFFEEELNQRRPLSYPPFSRLIDIRCRGKQERGVIDTLELLRDKLPGRDSVQVMGPTPCGIDYVKGEHRWHLLCRGSFDSSWKKKTHEILSDQATGKITVDVDPMDLM